jgi:hypothetical protein
MTVQKKPLTPFRGKGSPLQNRLNAIHGHNVSGKYTSDRCPDPKSCPLAKPGERKNHVAAVAAAS